MPTFTYSVLVFILFTLFATSFSQIIETKDGRLEGLKFLSENGREFFAFRSIPFGEPPIGEWRFQPPRPKEKWDGVFNATSQGPLCAQAALGSDGGEEDCLHLSVYSPKLPKSLNIDTKLPVLIWIPGGAFVSGGASDYDPYLMMNRNIVLVIPQYRLGMLGYYTNHSPYTTGNYGSLDQLLALRWVRDNIAAFGGDPNRVTLGGDCAGGVSAILHMMSPLSEGLFHRVISFSGSPLSPWTLHKDHNRLALMIANFVKCPSYDPALQAECFREQSVEHLLDGQRILIEARDIFVGNHNLAPVVQVPALTHESALILEDHPLKLILNGKFSKVPVMLEVTRDVGSYIVDMAVYDFIVKKMEEDPDYVNQMLEKIIFEIGIAIDQNVTERFESFYLPGWDHKTIDDAVPGIVEILGDTLYNAGILYAAQIFAEYVPTRLLRFDYNGGPKLFNLRNPNPEGALSALESSVSHGDELFFVLPYEPYLLSSKQKQVANNMLDIFEDFIYGSDPRVEWLTINGKDLQVAAINEQGNIVSGVRFVSEEKEQMLKYIFQKQYDAILQAIRSEGNSHNNNSLHDEL